VLNAAPSNAQGRTLHAASCASGRRSNSSSRGTARRIAPQGWAWADGAGEGGHQGGKHRQGGSVGGEGWRQWPQGADNLRQERQFHGTKRDLTMSHTHTHCSKRSMSSSAASAQRRDASRAERCTEQRARPHAARRELRLWPRHQQLGARYCAPHRAAGVGLGRWGR